jgi:hypothetical protein
MMRTDHSHAALVFVYNASSGLFNAVADMAHKAFSPQTYGCNLCALTHSTFGMRQDWKRFLETLGRPLEFLHADELENRYGIKGVPLPAVFRKVGESIESAIDADAINACSTIDDLKKLCEDKLR